MAAAARALSGAGEHAALWLAGGLTAAALDPPRRTGWLRATALVAAAHLAGMGVKRAVRRPRPSPETYAPLVRTAGRHSFPSCHASSAAVAFAALHPPIRRLAVPAATAMCLARLVAGVHYPTDVVAGALLGAATARAGRAWLGIAAGRGRPGGDARLLTPATRGGGPARPRTAAAPGGGPARSRTAAAPGGSRARLRTPAPHGGGRG
ncbi:phosphatase PAP2 family protein [Streptomyces sp. NPDC004267]|uniref:phosphatase PAP2 family protein n=1 Tax=Streptomyces sp. NPDC004267 TaxID=3364694 RepID=UPI003697D611